VTSATDTAEAALARAAAFFTQGRLEEAVAACRQGLAIAPTRSALHNNLALALRRLGRTSEAIDAFETAITHDGRNVEAMSNLANTLRGIGRMGEALSLYRRALTVAPGHVDVRANFLMTLQYATDVAPREVTEEHRRWGELFASTPRDDHGARARDEGKRLRVGYLSPDFRAHSVAWFLDAILRCHDAQEVEVFGYADVARPDGTTARFATQVQAWRNVHALDDAALAARIAEDEIDVLVELAGHTEHSRLGVMARRPAPVQVTYLGYPCTTGLAAIDYRIVDALTDPPGSEALSTETLVRPAPGFLVYAPPWDAPEVAPLPAARAGFVTFGSFNATSKLNEDVLATWAALLARVPDSRLVLKGLPFADDAVCARFRNSFATRGIAPERVWLRPFAQGREAHLATYGEIDVALDTFPYNGTTTTCEALWMGVPVVTLGGAAHAGRVGVSLLTQVGRTAWIADTRDAYVAIAAALAADRSALAAERATLRETVRASGLTDGPGFTRALERFYRAAWRGFCQGRAPSEVAALLARDVAMRAQSLTVDTASAQAAREPDIATLAAEAETLGALRKRREALGCARRAWEALRRGASAEGVPADLLAPREAPSVEGLLIRQCLAFAGDSMFFERETPRELLLRWAEIEPACVEAYFRFGLLFALEAREAGKPVPGAALAALDGVHAAAQQARTGAASQLARRESPRIALPFRDGELIVPGRLTHAATFALLESGDWYDPDLAVLCALLDAGDTLLDLEAGVGAYAVAAAACVGPTGAVHAVALPAGDAPYLHANATQARVIHVHAPGKPLAALVAATAARVVKVARNTDAAALTALARTHTTTLFAVPLTPGEEPERLIAALREAEVRAWTYCPARHAFAPWSPGAIDGHGLIFCVRDAERARLAQAAPFDAS
jgi:predicted O-linked N-acetylglucosamine transferase (SPINDLY family)